MSTDDDDEQGGDTYFGMLSWTVDLGLLRGSLGTARLLRAARLVFFEDALEDW